MSKRPLRLRDPARYNELVKAIDATRDHFNAALNAAADAGLDIGVAVRPWPERPVKGGSPRLRVLTMQYGLEPAAE